MTVMHVKLQEEYSRLELLARTFLAPIYIGVPHFFLLTFLGIWSQIVTFISFWSILFTGRYPESFFEYNVQYLRWNWRVNARMNNLCDGYPKFGLKAEDEYTSFDVEYPNNLSKVHALLKFLFGFLYALLPHAIAILFRSLVSLVLSFVAFWAVLFTGSYPEALHRFNVGTMRWSMRLNLYIFLMTDQYPPFTGAPLNNESPSTVLDSNLKNK